MDDTRQTKVQLLHDHVYTIPGQTNRISLKAGDKFVLVKKVSANWWAVLRSLKDTEILYVPSCYAEELPHTKTSEEISGSAGKKTHPPKPPVKPKNLYGKLESPTEANKFNPVISEEAKIELFEILTSDQNSLLQAGKGCHFSEGSVTDNDEGNMDSSSENYLREGCGTVMRHKGSMQSLDLEFLDDGEFSPGTTHDKVTDGNGESQLNTNFEAPRTHAKRLSDSPPYPPDGTTSIKTFDGGYEMFMDDESGRMFYYNRQTGDRSWVLPRKVSQSPKNLAEGDHKETFGAEVRLIWTEEVNEKGEAICVNQANGERWIRLRDENGREYFFNDDAQESRWELPEFGANYRHKFNEGPDNDVYQFAEKSGVLYKARLSDNGKKIKKSWSSSYLMLCGPMLYFYKEQKASNSLKPNMSKPESFVDLRSATINMGGNVRSSRKNLIQLVTTSGSEYLLHHDEVEVIEEWYEALSKNISLLSKLMNSLKTEGSSHSLNNEIEKSPESPGIQKKQKEKEKTKTLKKGEVIQIAENPQLSADKTKLKEKLRFWLNRRPTRDSLRAKGIYKESIFGSHLLTICDKENSSVPKFVQDCINAVETRGITTDGIYRLSGNMANIQRLRYTVNQNDHYNLLDPELDIHVVTGALKLFFRELLEPVFPFRFFRKFLDAFALTDSSAKVETIKELMLLVPSANYDTIKRLFQHLVLVIKHSRENRMQSQNIAIVFGPTLMWPEETDNSDLAVSVVQRGQFIEYVLQEYNFIFDA